MTNSRILETAPPLLAAERLVKEFPGVRALDGATLTMRAGSVHALLGENGAGKSTLIKALTGLHRPDAGTLEVEGRPIVLNSSADAVRAGVAVVHQERNLIPEFSVAENITLRQIPSRRGLVDREVMRDTARRCLDLLGLDLDIDAPVKGLSVAQTQLVEIAKALSTESRVLLLDEPTSALTMAEADRLYDVVGRLRDQGRSILLVSHKLEEIFAHCDTVTVLRDGSSVLEAAPLSSYSTDEVVDLMVGRSHTAVQFAPRPTPTEGPAALELDGVATAGGHQDVSLAVRRGEIVGLYGLVGAGRTELARAILGLDRLTDGQIRVNGEPARIGDVRSALNTYRIGYVPENRKEEGLFLDQSLTMNIAVTVWERIKRAVGYVPRRKERDLAADYTTRLGIRSAGTGQQVSTLSGGNQQKVSLAKWLAAQTEILIIDEPTVGIDVRTKAAFHELIWNLAADGLAIVLITSDLPEMVTLADRVGVMREFRIAGWVDNDDHDYGTVSRAVIDLIHAREPASEPTIVRRHRPRPDHPGRQARDSTNSSSVLRGLSSGKQCGETRWHVWHRASSHRCRTLAGWRFLGDVRRGGFPDRPFVLATERRG
ncbi:ABC transporter permease [Streptomyces tanashiensis]|uniref:sugar ABC transporter ATP-binding protein n=1 Tax=Streptomyces tanashiensis TaxID=67367 RepID=UPI0019C334FC|nr:sugar ABC transporter ATP-binding protein [Streptomyces tanashiensis]GGT26167.1 ABC transporter permease [Streptomyces tanashiensis]